MFSNFLFDTHLKFFTSRGIGITFLLRKNYVGINMLLYWLSGLGGTWVAASTVHLVGLVFCVTLHSIHLQPTWVFRWFDKWDSRHIGINDRVPSFPLEFIYRHAYTMLVGLDWIRLSTVRLPALPPFWTRDSPWDFSLDKPVFSVNLFMAF